MEPFQRRSPVLTEATLHLAPLGIKRSPAVIARFRRLLPAVVAIGVLAVPSTAAARPPLRFLAPGATVQPSRVLRVAGRLTNVHRSAISDVRIRSARVAGLQRHVKLAFRRIGGGQAVIVQLRFHSRKPLTESRYRLALRGTYRPKGGHRKRPFLLRQVLRLSPPAPGRASAAEVKIPSQSVFGAPFKSRPPRFDLGEVNASRWTVPAGPGALGKPTGPASSLEGAFSSKGARASDRGAVEFRTDSGLGTNGLTIAEPSGATAGSVVFATVNRSAAYSTNSGATFSQLDPTTIFPNDSIGFCCDQVVQYVPAIDRFFWLLQGTNGFRLATASPAAIAGSGGTAWTYWNLPSTLFGQPSGTGLDYPDVSVGNNALYLSWDNGYRGCPAGCRTGLQVSRIDLRALQAGGTISIAYTHPQDSADAWGSHLMQDTGDEIFWAGHESDSRLRVFSWREGSNSYFWRDVDVSRWANNALSSTTPDGQNWLEGSGGFPGHDIIGATRAGNRLWFAWDAGTDANFPQAHIEMVALDRSHNFARVQQVQVWNPGFAFGYPSLATLSCAGAGEVAMSLETGGGGSYENHAVGFWGDFLVYLTTHSTVGTNRFGDYVTIRNAPATEADPGNLFAAFGYGLTRTPPPASAVRTDARYVLFGRPRDRCIQR